MGGVTNPIKKLFDKPEVKQAVASAPAPSQAAQQSASATQQREQAEDVMARRRARRGGRALLSEARLNPEQGVGQTTLGVGPM